uniref:Uncharacterized protein n=1 Tax=Candidatus Kentrum sp. FW TaxID=2126338 RepID=A0A450SSL0_9GAMM|nr:MAG: hypothetical protein BECKFW1821A_GA0114235_10653 [Candidatus Kentron sp. FW]
MPFAADLHMRLMAELAPDPTVERLMSARLANAQGRWNDVIGHTDALDDSSRFKGVNQLLTAHALAHLGRPSKAYQPAHPDWPINTI